MKFLLIQPPLEDFYTTPIRFYPLGLLYAAEALRQLGYDVQILDCLTPFNKKKVPLPPEFHYLHPFLGIPGFFKHYFHFGKHVEEILSAIVRVNPDYIGISSNFTAYYQSVDELVKSIRAEFDIPVFIGGHHATVLGKEIKRRTPEIDFILPGPAEESIPKFLAEIDGGIAVPLKIDWQRINPNHNLLTADKYKIGKKNYISLLASRGCPYSCEFCSVHRMFGRKVVYRTVEDVIHEIVFNYLNRNVKIFNFEDDNLTVNQGWFKNFLRKLGNNNTLREIELTAMNGLCFPTLDEETLYLMRQAGFRSLNLSFITRDNMLQTRYQRPMPSTSGDQHFKRIVRTAHRLNLFVTVYLILGLPGQTFTEIKDSVDYLLDLGVLVGPSIFYLPPGSGLFDELTIPEDIKVNWNYYRSSAFAVETDDLKREQLVELFCYIRKRNLERR